MGGIKNKLSKLSNKVKTLFNKATNLLPLLGEADENRRFSIGGVNKQDLLDKVNNNGSRLPSFSQPSKMPDGQISNTRKLSHLGLYASKTISSLRPTSQNLPLTKNTTNKGPLSLKLGSSASGTTSRRTLASKVFDDTGSPLGLAEGSLFTGLSLTILTKYLGIACLSLAILSTLVLNIISSYSNSSTRSNAEPVGNVSTLANDSACDPANTNAESCISLAITSSSSSSSTGGNDANLSLSIPQGGGIATGRHTVEVSSNPTSQAFIQSTTGTLTNPSPLDKGQWGSWGIALPNSSLYTGFNTNEADYNSTNQDVLTRTTWAAVPGKESDDSDKTIIKTTASSKKTDSYPVYYGVRVDSPVSVPADTYTAQVVYTATTNEVPVPTITNLSQNSYELGSDTNLDSDNRLPVTITGTNLQSTYRVYLVSNADTNIQYDLTNNITSITDTQLKVTLPTDITNSDLEAGEYTIHVVTQGGEASVGFTYTEKRALSVYDSIDNVRVDYDENMIPVKYVGYDGNGGGYWAVITDAEMKQNTNNWFRYDTTEKRWANAITVTAEAREAYREKQTGEDPDPTILPSNNSTGNGEANPEILGYWVYVPRYAYEVQRRDAVDASVDPQNFDIVFQTADEKNAPAATCSTISSHKDYRTECGIPTTYTANSGNTTWTTHPAFTFGSTELNGIWVGKFETTGTRVNPTVKPNQHANISESVGNFYTAAKHIGIYDQYNIGGNNVTGKNSDGNEVTLVAHTSTEWSSLHNLANATSHMLKNSEWGALIYLAHSDYGAGINSERTRATNVNKNGATVVGSTDADGDADTDGASAATGCGSSSTGSDNSYTVSTQLNAITIESPSACGSADKSYNSSDGVLASTTNNIYGAYDTYGGVYEYVAGARTSKQNSSESTNVIENEATYPFVDLYRTVDGFGKRPSWASGGNNTESGYNFIVCTYELCGGTSTYETNISDNVPGIQNSWGFVASQFVWPDQQWFRRGGSASYNKANPFYINPQDGQGYYYNGFRAVLILATDH